MRRRQSAPCPDGLRRAWSARVNGNTRTCSPPGHRSASWPPPSEPTGKGAGLVGKTPSDGCLRRRGHRRLGASGVSCDGQARTQSRYRWRPWRRLQRADLARRPSHRRGSDTHSGLAPAFSVCPTIHDHHRPADRMRKTGRAPWHPPRPASTSVPRMRWTGRHRPREKTADIRRNRTCGCVTPTPLLSNASANEHRRKRGTTRLLMPACMPPLNRVN